MAGVLIWSLVLILFLIGILGTLIPALPGIGLIWLGILVYAWATHFEDIGVSAVIVLGAVSVITSFASYAGGMLAAKAGGGSRLAILGAGIGAVVGMAIANIAGLLAGGFLGALAGTLWETRHTGVAARRATLTVAGILLGTVLQFLVGVAIISGFFIDILVGP